MRSQWRSFALALGLALTSSAVLSPVRAEDPSPVQPWEYLGEGFIGSYLGPSLIWHVSAVAVTPPLVFGLDVQVQDWFQKPGAGRESFAQATFAFGAVAPVLIPGGLWLGGLLADAPELATAGAAALQAAAVQAVVITTLKWLTDRAGPYPDGDPTRRRASSSWFHDSTDPNDFNFNPFDIAGGLRWPSGHTASNIAVVSALVAFYPDEPWLAAIGYPLALAIGIGMIEGDYHWLSDVVAGGLMGHAIGWSIGRNFRKRYDARRNGAPLPASGVELRPGLGAPLSISGWF